MIKKIIKVKKSPIFVCQATEHALKVVKFVPPGPSLPKETALAYELLTGPLSDAPIPEKFAQLLKKLGYAHEPVCVCLPRNAVTSRYLKVPSQAPEEIEKIVSLQASRLIPYSADELNTGFEVIETDKEGFSEVNAIIVLKGVIERCLKISEALKPSQFSVGLSSLGLCTLYARTAAQDNAVVMLVDIDAQSVELAVARAGHALFSRSIKFPQVCGWEDSLADEILKTIDAYHKEVPGKSGPEKIVVLAARAQYELLLEALAKKIKIPAEQFLYSKETELDEKAQQVILESNLSFASLLGLSAVKVPAYANLLPGNLKQEAKTRAKGKERLRIAVSILLIFALVVTATLINIKRKTAHLDHLKGQLSKISKEAKTLEAIEERFQLLAKYSSDRVSSLDILRELHRTIPPQASLLNFSYDDGQELTIRGRAPDLNLVFGFVSSLQSSAVLKKYTSKVRYATQKRTQAGEVVDFEISCVKER